MQNENTTTAIDLTTALSEQTGITPDETLLKRNASISVTLPGPGGMMPTDDGCIYWERIFNEDVNRAHAEGRIQEHLERRVESYKRCLGFSLSFDGEPVGLKLGWLDHLPQETQDMLKAKR